MDFKRLPSKFEDRIKRANYWRAIHDTAVSCVFFLLIFKAGLKLIQVAFLAVFRNPLPFDPGFSDALLLFAGWNIESLAAITIRRLHDRNKSGWWMVPFFLAPLVLLASSDWLANPTLAQLIDALGYGLGAWCFIELLCLSGTRGPNRFGSDPLAPRKAEWVERSEIDRAPPSVGPLPAWLVRRDHESASAGQCSRR
jgi:uncharacterized membrane protein YhaH (DUF805 family)